MEMEVALDGKVAVVTGATGGIGRAMVKHYFEGLNAASVDAVIERLPLDGVGTPEDGARAALFLCSDAASFITGATVAVDGGFLLHNARVVTADCKCSLHHGLRANPSASSLWTRQSPSATGRRGGLVST